MTIGLTKGWIDTKTNGQKELSLAGHTHSYAASSHTHTKAQITDFPTTMTPAAHTHVASDVTSGTFDAARIPNLNASKITAGTLPVSRGGTGNTSVDATPTSGSTKMCTSGGIYTAINTVKTSVSEGKALVAAAVTDKGVTTAADATFATMASNIGNISTAYTLSDLALNGLFYSAVQLNATIIYINYSRSKIPKEFYFHVMGFNQFNGYQNILEMKWATIPNLGTNGSVDIALHSRQDSAHTNNYQDGTQGTIVQGTESVTTQSVNFTYTTSFSGYIYLYIRNLPSLYTGGNLTAITGYVIPIY